jgi:hypothetical protein
LLPLMSPGRSVAVNPVTSPLEASTATFFASH